MYFTKFLFVFVIAFVFVPSALCYPRDVAVQRTEEVQAQVIETEAKPQVPQPTTVVEPQQETVVEPQQETAVEESTETLNIGLTHSLKVLEGISISICILDEDHREKINMRTGGIRTAKVEHVHGRVPCQYEDATEDTICQQHCLPKGYSYGICVSYRCSCV